ncbi:MAG TPA: hypothetical protein VN840_07240 [Streptosporangiaceae bacterium]|nr:hypothetical protein [Streptosporangiaceae bacterium]
MVPGVSLLRISLAAARDLFRTQIADGEQLLRRMAAASVAGDLAQVSDVLSAWSARNEAVYVRALGAAAGREYRAGISEAVDAVRGSGQKRSEMVRRADAGLRMLRRTAAVLDLVPDGVPAAGSSSAARQGAGAGAGRGAAIPVPAVAGSRYHLSEPVRRPEDGTVTAAAQWREGPGSARVSGSTAPAVARRPAGPGARPGPRGKPGGHRGQPRRAARVRGLYIIIIIAAVIGTILAVVLATG